MAASPSIPPRNRNYFGKNAISQLRNAFEHAYSRGIFREVDNVLIQIHNRIPAGVPDILLVGGSLSATAHMMRYPLPRLSSAMDYLVWYGLSHVGLYLANRARKPLEETLDLEIERGESATNDFYDWLEQDLINAGQRIRELPEVIDLRRDTIGDVEQALRSELTRIEGKDPGTFPQQKKYSLFEYLLESGEILASYGLLSPEIFLSPSLALEEDLRGYLSSSALAHELVHSKGYTRENEAECISHLALMHSGNPVLMKSSLLNRLWRNLNAVPGLGSPLKRLHKAGLPPETQSLIEEFIIEKTDDEIEWDWAFRLAREGLIKLRHAALYVINGTKVEDYNIGYLRLVKAIEDKYGRI